jgi:hypothetical protein
MRYVRKKGKNIIRKKEKRNSTKGQGVVASKRGKEEGNAKAKTGYHRIEEGRGK